MFNRYVFLLFVSISLINSALGQSIESESDNLKHSQSLYNDSLSLKVLSDSTWKPCISPFIELLGKGFLSVNVDFRIKESFAVSIGIQPMEGLMPNIMGYYFSGKRRRLETGGGLSVGFANDFSVAGYLIHGVIGYRYQNKKGMFFRAGFTPLYVIFIDDPERSNKFYPFPGVSFGYSF